MSQDKSKPTKIALALTLFVATVLAQLANIVYEGIENGTDIVAMLVPSMSFLTLLTVPAIFIGFKLGEELNISPLFHSDNTTSNRLLRPIPFAIIFGVSLGIILLGVREITLPYLPSEAPQYGFRGVIGGLLVSIGAAVGEEVWFRFGLMTLLLWSVKRLLKLPSLSNNQVWVIILVVSVGFAAAHLPQLMAYGAGTTFAIWGTMLGNIAVSCLYSWCFWRYGLMSAIIAHFSLDVVLHVLPAVI